MLEIAARIFTPYEHGKVTPCIILLKHNSLTSKHDTLSVFGKRTIA